MLNMIRLLSRILFYIIRYLLKIVESIAPRIYMPMYLRLLNQYGLILKGTPRYIASKIRIDEFSLVTLGDKVVISEGVTFLSHDYSLTTGLIAINKCPPTDQAFLKPITIGNNVFIGLGALILPGTNIGDNVIVGAGSVVRGSIPGDSIVIGNPAKIIGPLSEKAEVWFKKMPSSKLRVDKK